MFRFNGYDDSTLCLELSYPYGHKHFSPWMSLSADEFTGPSEFYSFDGSNDCLFIVIFRNPYDWVKSQYHNPWHNSEEMKKLPFDQFIRSPWMLDQENIEMKKLQSFNPLVDLDPETRSPFDNVLKLRTEKLRNMISIGNKVENIYFVKYEDVSENPNNFIQTIQKNYTITRSKNTDLINYYKGDKKQGVYNKKTYFEINQEDLNFINSELDAELEKKIGYILN